MKHYEKSLTCVFAAYRLARMVSIEDGPFNVFKIFRSKFQPGWLADGVNCPLCVGFWFSWLIWVTYKPFKPFWEVFAIAGGQIAIQTRENGW